MSHRQIVTILFLLLSFSQNFVFAKKILPTKKEVTLISNEAILLMKDGYYEKSLIQSTFIDGSNNSPNTQINTRLFSKQGVIARMVS